MRGEGLVRRGNRKLQSARPATRFVLSLYPLTAQADTLDTYVHDIERSARHCDTTALDTAYQAHCAWWRAFWDRSWIHLRGTPEAEAVAQGYQLQRFINACGGRGAHPIKFNGSIFTVDSAEPTEPYDADYRRWGGAYWFQNTRLPYWSMIMCGDVDLANPLFRMYRDALPMAEEISRAWFKHGGACFAEIITFWGTHLNWAYGFDRRGKKPGYDYYIGTAERYWQGMLELLAMMLDVYDITRDEKFLHDPLLELARSFLRFYREHFPERDDEGKMLIKPGQALETWQWAVNPMPDVAGLSWTLDRLIELPKAFVPGRDRRVWSAMRSVLPPIPMRRGQTMPGQTPSPWFLVPGREYDLGGNAENAELYAVFPYRLFGVGKPHLEAGRLTFTRRAGRLRGGWTQDAIHAAMLGLTDEAKADVIYNFTTKHDNSRFPAFWGPNFDWVPDQDHGSTAMIALQRMLMQWDQGKMRLLPAWPMDWQVDFRLHAPGQTIVEGSVKDGKITSLTVTPRARAADVIVCGGDTEGLWGQALNSE